MPHLYTYSCNDIILFLIYIYETVFFPVNVAVLFTTFFFLPTIHIKLFHFLQVDFFPVDISDVYVMSSTTSQYFSAFHTFLNKEKTSAETETKLDFVSSIWDDDHIWRLDGEKLAILMV